MTTLRGAIGNGSVLLVAQVTTWTASLVLTAALGRHLGAAGYGDLYLAMGFTAIFGLIVEFGLDQQVTRAIARDRTLGSHYLSAAVVIKTVAAAVSYPLMLVTVVALGYDEAFQRTTAVFGVALLSIALSASLSTVYQAAQNIKHAAIATVIEKVFVAVAVLLLFKFGFGVVEVAAAMVVASALGAVWKARFMGGTLPVVWRPDRRAIGALLRGTPPFLLYAILGTIYYRLDTVLLSKLTNATVVGWYGAAYRLFDTMFFLPSIVSAALMFPILAKLSLGSRGGQRAAVTRGIQTISVVGVPISVGLYFVADPVIRLVYGGGDFQPAADALRWLMPGLLVLYLNSVLTVALMSVNRERRMTLIAAVACAFNVGLNLVLIPVFQHVGAAAVTSATELLIFGYLLLNVPRDILEPRAFVTLLKAGVAAIVMAAALVPLQGSPLLVQVAAGAAAYSLAGYGLRLIPADDIRLLRAAVGRRAPVLSGASET
jgi:O-antigen/teichoic acid export membrane protein